MNYEIMLRCAIALIAGWFLGFLSTRSALKEKYKNTEISRISNGILHLVYDRDDPSHPAMGLEIDSLNYILTHDEILLEVKKTDFPKDNPA